MLELKNIISVDWNSDRTEILVTLEGNIPITIDEGGNIARLERTFLRYNQNIGSNGRPIAYDTERNLILPSTVSMSVELVGNPERRPNPRRGKRRRNAPDARIRQTLRSRRM